ncbi:O-antigen ligase family protein [Stieleria maiorica]|uniref:O-antigen ligase family protein n=1 Tax=Stieleria maiorica TaxID=2795974 RepID=UPI001F3D230F|nr:O-antigen ligase family protein [Stieleria maiorica]
MIGIGATISSSLWGGVTVILAYLLNPHLVAREIPLQRYQFYATAAFVLSTMMYPASRLRSVGVDKWVFTFLWFYVADCCVVSLLLSRDPLWAIDHAIEFGKTILVAWLLTKIVHSERDIRILLIACVIGGFHAAFMHTVGIDLDWVSEKYKAEYGVLPEAQAPTNLLLLPLFVLIAMLGSTRYEKLLGWMGLPIVLNSIVESYQRAYFVGLLAESVFLLLFLPKRIAIRLIPVLAVAIVLYVSVLTPENYWSWMDTINEPTKEGSAASRYDLYKASGEMLADHPLGVGYRSFILESKKYYGASKAAHSTICTVACETGVQGFCLWLGAVLTTFWILRRIRKAADPSNPHQLEVYAMGIEIGLIGWLVGGLFHSDHQTDPAYWFLAFAVVLHRLRFAPPEIELDPNAPDAAGSTFG